jgi:two-component system, cell cycle response regulator
MAFIALLDDDALARSMYSDMLRGAGHHVQSVANASEAIAVLRSSSPIDVFVTDLILPKGDGIELLFAAKSARPDVEVVVITALDKVEPAVRAIKNGASDYLLKPIRPEVLVHAVQRALTQRSLLTENADLRRSVALLEAGQRIATILDREKLPEAVGLAFQQHCGADAICLFHKLEQRMELIGTWGVNQADVEALTSSLYTKSPLPAQWLQSVTLPIGEQAEPTGQLILLYRQIPDSDKVALAPFLSRHLALALRNLGRIAAVEDLIYLDPLTHLFNSRFLEVTLQRIFQNQGKDSPPFSVLFLDLDRFKAVNDTHGHLVGSKALIEVARILKGALRDNDVVCRWGGDEFVILLRATDSGGALKVAERIRRSIESHLFLAREGQAIKLTTCIGVASYPEHLVDQTGLVDFADRAMYRGKKGGRNVIYLASAAFENTPEERHRPIDSSPSPTPRILP